MGLEPNRNAIRTTLPGFGKLIFGDGSYYQGEFADNEIMGQGTRYFATTRNTYTGHFYYGNSMIGPLSF